MTRRNPLPDDPEQYRRFVEVARELGVDENDPDAMDRAFRQTIRPLPKAGPQGAAEVKPAKRSKVPKASN